MGLRQVRVVEDPILTKVARPIKEINERILHLLDDMVETMREGKGIGLAAPQVGVLRRCFVCEVEEGEVYKIINPEILEKEGSDIDIEGCLSIPDYNCTVERAEKIKMKYTDVDGKEQVIEADGMFAKCLQHEYDHLDGILISSKAIDVITKENMDEIYEKLGYFNEEDGE